MEPTKVNSMPWYFKLFALTLFLSFLLLMFRLGYEFGITKTKTDHYDHLSSSIIVTHATSTKLLPSLLPTASSTQELIPLISTSSSQVEASGYKLKPDWAIFSHKLCSPFQIQYPRDWRMFVNIQTFADFLPEHIALVFQISKIYSAKTFYIKIFHNPKNLSVEEWSNNEAMPKEYPNQPRPSYLKAVYEPYRTINGTKMMRRFIYEPLGLDAINYTRIDLVFTKDKYGYVISATKEMSESEFLEIAETFVLGKEKDFPLYKQMKEQYPFKSNVVCSSGCSMYPGVPIDWCTGKEYSQETESTCTCDPS